MHLHYGGVEKREIASSPEGIKESGIRNQRGQALKIKGDQRGQDQRGQALYFAVLSFFHSLQRLGGCFNSFDSIRLTLKIFPIFK